MIRKVFLSSTADDLGTYRAKVAEALQHLAIFPDRMEIFGARPEPSVALCLERAAEADAVVAIVAHRYGWKPSIDEGGDAVKSITRLELEAAKPDAVFAYLVDEGYDWPFGRESHRLEEPGADAAEVQEDVRRLQDFKRELSRRPRERFTTAEDLALKVVRDLTAWLLRSAPALPGAPPPPRLRRPQPPALPDQPYPLLGPYTHPDLFAGRGRDRDEVLRLLCGPLPIVGLHAPSGAGKTSLLHAGLLPALLAEGTPVALVDHPEEPGIHGKLLGQLLDLGEADQPDPAAPGSAGDALRSFRQRLAAARQLAGRPPVLIVDQFEHLFRTASGSAGASQPQARARLGLLLAATLADFVTGAEPLCRWLLVSRSDHHAQVRPWLANVLGDARRAGVAPEPNLPADLSHRFDDGGYLPVFGSPTAGALIGDPDPETARALFLEAIEKPLRLRIDGAPRYRERFAPGAAERLAAAFARERVERPELPLVPELQVVLAHLRSQAKDGPGSERVLDVPDDPSSLLRDAVADHLARALHRVFPGTGDEAREDRAVALLTLRRLALDDGRRGDALAADLLAAMLGPSRQHLLGRLAEPDLRLLLSRPTRRGEVYELSHDAVAQAVVAAVERQGAGLGLDEELIRLRAGVALSSDLWQAGGADEKKEAARLSFSRAARIVRHRDALLTSPSQQGWWRACTNRFREDLEAAPAGRALEALAAFAAAEPGAAPPVPTERLVRLLESGPGELGMEWAEIAVEAAGAVAAAEESWRSRIPALGTTLWLLDRASATTPPLRDRAQATRGRLLALLGPPPAFVAGEWAAIPPGSFRMGTEGAQGAEGPAHTVHLSPFRLQRCTVTAEELARFREARADPKEVRLPATEVDWYEAYLYAAWLGGRLPTEAEWEYACRAGTTSAYWSGDTEKNLAGIGWYTGNTKNIRPVKGKTASPWGLHDMHGNVWEWAADVYAPYEASEQHDPWGPLPAFDGDRVLRGGSWYVPADNCRSACRYWGRPGDRFWLIGFRVRLPAPERS